MNMKQSFISVFVRCLTLTLILSASAHAVEPGSANPIASIKTNFGTIDVELFENDAPITVKNFVEYANSKHFAGTIFHRVIPNFMIQGGGFDTSFTQKATRAPIINEAKPSLPNTRGTIAMARTSVPDSATSQFFINVVNNHFLNKTTSNPGYAVFGKVVKGMDVADKIAAQKTGTRNYMRDVPVSDIVIEAITIK